ncbi:MAG: sortase, partial [Candidatus Gracilibacteria bacterium]
TRDLENITRIKVREVLQDGYIPFTDTLNPNGAEFTAELYCGIDIKNYDNVEYIQGEDLGYGKTVQCVAWNVPKGPDPLGVCENDFSVNNQKDLSIIDLSTGLQTYVNDLAFGSSAAAADRVTGNVYYLENTNGNPRLGVYDIATHTNTVIGFTNTQRLFTKMAFNRDGVLYAMSEYKSSNLFTINTLTGEATHIDATGLINKDGGDLIFDDNGDLYVMVKNGKFYRVAVTTNTTATFLGYVNYLGNNIDSTGLVFKDGLFYVTDNNNSLYSFSLDDISDLTKITNSTNNINDLASCPVEILPDTGSVAVFKFNDRNEDTQWNEPCGGVIIPDNELFISACMDDEWGLDGWEMVLSNSGTTYTGTTVEGGHYIFNDVPVGEYTLCEVQQIGWFQTLPVDNECYSIVVELGSLEEYQFGNHEITSGEVTLCKEDSRGNPLSGWNLQLLGNSVEEVIVPTTTGTPVSSASLSEGNYVLVANGTYEYRGTNGLLNDANYSERLLTDGYSGDYFPWINVNNLNTPYEGYLGIMVNGVPTNWSNYLAGDHEYAIGFSSYSGTFDFTVLDTGYSDNVGDLEVEIFEGYAGTTGENGCVTFEDVPFGYYTIDETLKVDWEIMSGLGEELVDIEHNVFTIVNQDTNAPEKPETSSVGGYKFNDLNENSDWDNCGVREIIEGTAFVCLGYESPLGRWEITLSGSSYTGTTLTNENGYYLFDNIPVGEYTICETQQEGWTQTFPSLEDEGCHNIVVGVENEEEYDFGNYEDEIPTFIPSSSSSGGGSSIHTATCDGLEITTDLGTSTGSIELTCNGNADTEMFMLDCGDGSAKQIKTPVEGSSSYATFVCDYDVTESYTPVCSVSVAEIYDENSTYWKTSSNVCTLDISFNDLITYTVEEEIVAAGEELIKGKSDSGGGGGGGIERVFNDYVDKGNELKDIEIDEEKIGKSSIESLPQILLKTGTPISERVGINNDNRVELNAPPMTSSFINDINIWKLKLPEEDRNRGEYIVVPSNGLIVPVNYVPNDSEDYEKLINGREVNVNPYLRTGVMSYPSTSSAYGEVGNRVIYGHSSYWKFDNGRYKTQFQKIIELDVGEEIWVYKIQSNGEFERFVYRVEKSFETEPTNVGIMNPGMGSNLTLITCTPIGGIEGRWVVQAKFVNEDKAELEKYLYGESVAAKYRIAISRIINRVEALDNEKREQFTLEIFSKIEDLEQSIQGNIDISNMLNYFKLQLAISYQKISNT